MDLPKHEQARAIADPHFSSLSDRQRLFLALNAHPDEVSTATVGRRGEGNEGAGFANLELAACSPLESENLGLWRLVGENNGLARPIRRMDPAEPLQLGFPEGLDAKADASDAGIPQLPVRSYQMRGAQSSITPIRHAA